MFPSREDSEAFAKIKSRRASEIELISSNRILVERKAIEKISHYLASSPPLFWS